jgi:peptide/nickel transport system substrate-binding protein
VRTGAGAKRFLCAALVGSLVHLGGCAKTAAPPGARGGGTLVIAERVEPNSLDPMLLEGNLSSLVGGVLYSYLLTWDRHGNLIPDAATEVPTLANGGISRDGLRITYHLRPGIRWSDGKPLTARDCVFTWRAIMNPQTNVPDRYGYAQIADVRAVGERTVVVRLDKPFSAIVDSFLTLPSNYPIIPEHTLGSLASLNHADVERPTIGSGPFTLVDWKRGDHITFAANPLYFRGRPHLDRLVLRFVPSPETMVDQLRTHEIDAALSLSDPTLRDRIVAIPGTHVILTPACAIATVYFNMQHGLTTDPQLRKAIALAIDTATIVRKATRGLYGAQDALRGEFASDALPNPTSYDPAAARTLLDRDGWPAGPNGMRTKAGRPLALTLVAAAGDPLITSIVVQMQAELHAVGIDLAIRSVDSALLKAPAADGGPLFGGRFDLAAAFIFSEAGPFAAQFFICPERAPTGFNISRICRPDIDRLYADILASSDPQRRATDVMAIQRILGDALPQLPFLQIRTIAGMSDRVHGIAPSPATPYVGLEKWSIDP